MLIIYQSWASILDFLKVHPLDPFYFSLSEDTPRLFADDTSILVKRNTSKKF